MRVSLLFNSILKQNARSQCDRTRWNWDTLVCPTQISTQHKIKPNTIIYEWIYIENKATWTWACKDWWNREIIIENVTTQSYRSGEIQTNEGCAMQHLISLVLHIKIRVSPTALLLLDLIFMSAWVLMIIRWAYHFISFFFCQKWTGVLPYQYDKNIHLHHEQNFFVTEGAPKNYLGPSHPWWWWCKIWASKIRRKQSYSPPPNRICRL